VVAVPPAQAATTRLEYIAQVDPICQSFEGPVEYARVQDRFPLRVDLLPAAW
jgi:hypothetical protein